MAMPTACPPLPTITHRTSLRFRRRLFLSVLVVGGLAPCSHAPVSFSRGGWHPHRPVHRACRGGGPCAVPGQPACGEHHRRRLRHRRRPEDHPVTGVTSSRLQWSWPRITTTG